MSKQEKAQKEMSIADYKLAMSKQSNRYQKVIIAVGFLIAGIITGWFLSQTVINDTQSKVVNSIELSVKE